MNEQRSAALLEWYRSRDRDIPWRGSSDPYLVLVGEVMAQQTQASRASAHFRPFVARFADAASLAEAPLAEVLSLWAGLGYNSRARRLRDAAAHIVAHGWPADLTELPGVGPYTAGAVACFAFGEERAIVDTNVRRVLGRWRGRVLNGEAAAEADRQLKAPAADWNQALMDLGSTICVGRAPACEDCPVARWCAGPDAYESPPRQSAYQGSLRQTRSAVLIHLARRGQASRQELEAATGLSWRRVAAAIEALQAEGLVVEMGAGYRVAD